MLTAVICFSVSHHKSHNVIVCLSGSVDLAEERFKEKEESLK